MTGFSNTNRQVNIRNSIATKLLRIVFSIYLIIAIGVTVGHMVMEYKYQKNSITKDLEYIQRTFEQHLAIDMWNMSEESLRSTVKGILEIPTIVGVKIDNNSGRHISFGGVIEHENKIKTVDLNVQLLNYNEQDSVLGNGKHYDYELFKRSFPIIYSYQDKKKYLGEATIYSSTSVIFRRVQLGFLMLVINAIVKTVALWFIFLWFSRILLRKPLSDLSQAAAKVHLDNLDSAKIEIETHGENELKALEDSFNLMITNLKTSLDQRKRIEHDRERLLKTLEQKNEELKSIVYIASHDLKSPLVNINGFSSILNESCRQICAILDDLKLSDDVKSRFLPLAKETIPESLKYITSSTIKMKSLLDGLLQVSRLGNEEIRIQKLDMNKLIQNIIETFAFQINESKTEIIVDDLPGCLGDEKQIDQVFSNILGNAINYLDPKRKGQVKITGKVSGKEAVYCVEDNGIGICPEHQSKVFELFHRLNPKDSTGGQGLGLTIAKRALSRNGGWIWIESEEGRGSKFFISLPVT